MLRWKQQTIAGVLPGPTVPPKVSAKPDFIHRINGPVE